VRTLYREAGYTAPVDATAAETLSAARAAVRDAEQTLTQARKSLAEAGSGPTALERKQADIAVAQARRTLAEAKRATPRDAAAVASAREQLTLAKLQRRESLRRPDLSGDRAAVRSAAEQLDAARTQVRTAETATLPYLRASEVLFLASLPRRVDAVNVSRGDVVSGPVMSVSGARIELSGSAADADATLLELGDEAFFELPDGDRHRAEITAIELSDSGGRATVRFTPDPLSPTQLEQLQGSNVRVQVPVGATEGAVLSVPFAALTAGPGRGGLRRPARPRARADQPGGRHDRAGRRRLRRGHPGGRRSGGRRPRGGRTMTALAELLDVTRAFPGEPEVQALKDVSLTVNDGDYLSIVGPSGSGKSTMLNILGLLDRPSVGQYRLAGQSTADLGDRQRALLRARAIGFIFQAFHLLPHRTVLDNVLLAMLYSGVPRRERLPRAMAALERVGLGHRVTFAPTTLSGGERQRVAIARAVVAGPRLLLADEPTGNLDQTTAGEVMALFEELHRGGLTLVVITHDDAIARRAGRRVRILDGRLSEEP
jgi:putative ABC transport system ATP-binding protein